MLRSSNIRSDRRAAVWGPHCSFCGTATGPFLEVQGAFTLLMCPGCQAARDGTGGREPPVLARHDPGQRYLQWTCALCPQQVFVPRDLEVHTTQQHPGWTARFEVVRPWPDQVLRVVYQRSAGQETSDG